MITSCLLKYSGKCHNATHCTEEGNEPCFKPYPPRMTAAEFTLKQTELLAEVPVQFRNALSYMAYERGHSGGLEEVIGILTGLVADLLPSIQQFKKDIENRC